MFLDGLVAGGAFLLIASVLVYAELLNSSARDGTAAQVFVLIFPVLDVVLATVAVLLVVRASRADRLMLVLVASAFLLYAASDLAFAVRTAQGDFHLRHACSTSGGSSGYLTLGAGRRRARSDGPARATGAPGGPSDALGTTLVFTVLVSAAVVQVLFGGRRA